jgi:hypothetical protein
MAEEEVAPRPARRRRGGAVVGLGDGFDDRQSETDTGTVGVGAFVSAKERLGEGGE